MRKHVALPFLVIFFFHSWLAFPAQAPDVNTLVPAQKVRHQTTRLVPKVCKACIRGHMQFLASDALRGRGSGTHDELVAATYVASALRQYHIEPAADDDSYIQQAAVLNQKITAPPQLTIITPGSASEPGTWTYGKEFLTSYLSLTQFSGPLQKVDANDARLQIKTGAVVLITGKDKGRIRKAALSTAAAGAVAALYSLNKEKREHFEQEANRMPELRPRLEDISAPGLLSNFNALQLTDDAMRSLDQMPEGTELQFHASSSEEHGYTWNVIGVLRGSDPSLQHAVILLSAHLDHLGIGEPVGGDDIYNGADDDASGTTAVLELARVLGERQRPRRTVIFVLFGSEEAGGLGSSYFLAHPPVSLKGIAAAIEFEMIGRPDPAVPNDTLWLTGWERSNLGPVLAAHGAHLVGDPHPAENFFTRSDNYVLAKKGVIAQTISSYGLHKDYHEPSDDLAHIDFRHMNNAIGALLKPMEWLVNSDFRPEWKNGEQP